MELNKKTDDHMSKHLLLVYDNLADRLHWFTMMVTMALCSGGRGVVTPPLYVPKLLEWVTGGHCFGSFFLCGPVLRGFLYGRVNPALGAIWRTFTCEKKGQ